MCSKAGARIVFVGSRAGTLSILQPQLQQKFADPNLTQDQLDQLMEEFPKEVSPLPPGLAPIRKADAPRSTSTRSKNSEAMYWRGSRLYRPL